MSPVLPPTRQQLEQAVGHFVPDVIAPGIRVLFCGINPSLYSAVVGHHFARPGNRFWPALHASGFTPRLLRPDEELELLRLGCGITNVSPHATARADQLHPDQLRQGFGPLVEKVTRFQPQFLAVLGVSAYRTAFARPRAGLGRQAETIGDTGLWVLPNPSGLNAHYQLDELSRLFGELRAALTTPTDNDSAGAAA